MANDAKQQFFDSIRGSLPPGVLNFLETPIGQIPEVTVPEDVEAAVIANGIVMAHINNYVLRPFRGLTPVEVIMRNGQLNSLLGALVLSALELISGANLGFEVIAPEEGQAYNTQPITFSAKMIDPAITAITVTMDDETLDLTETDGVFRGESIVTPGDHTATFAADTGKSQNVSFYITEFEIVTYPAEGDTVIGPVFELRAEPPDDLSITQIICNLAETTYTLTKDTASNTWTALVDLTNSIPDAAQQAATFTVTTATDTYEKVVNFVLELVD